MKKNHGSFVTIKTLTMSEVVSVAQVVVILVLLILSILKLFFTKLSCEETSVWFSVLSGLVSYVVPNAII